MAYLGKSPSQGVRSRFYFTATGGETSLSGSDDNSNTLVFSDGNYVDVSLNGLSLVAGTDYNTTTANTIGGLTALSASDVVEIVVYDTFSVFSGNVNGDFTVSGDLTVDTNTLYVDSTNNEVGIGTLTPGGSLEIYKAGTSEVLIGTDNGGTAQLSLYEANDGTKEGLLKYDGTNNRIHLATSGAANALVIPRDSGYVGINQSSPATPLHINGAPGTSTLRLDAGGTLGGARRNWAISAEKYAAGALSIEYGSTEGAAPSNAAMTIASDGTITVKGEGTNTTEVSQGLCKQWVKFDSTGTFEIDDSFNTSSVTDSGTGHAVPNVNNDFANVGYATSASCNEPFGATTIVHITTYAVGSYNVLTQADSSNTRKDVDFGVATSFGDLS